MVEKKKEIEVMSSVDSTLRFRSNLVINKIERFPAKSRLSLKEMLYWALPHRDLPKEVLQWRLSNARMIVRELYKLRVMMAASRYTGYPFMYGQLWVSKVNGLTGEVVPFGLASVRLVTNAGRDEIVDEFDAATAAGFDLTSFNFHGIGTGTTAAAVGDTALQTELTTEYNPNSTRATGTQSQPTSDVYRTVATNTLDSGTPAVTEAGCLSQAATGGGVLLDRFVFSAINLTGANGDGLQTTINLTLPAGS